MSKKFLHVLALGTFCISMAITNNQAFADKCTELFNKCDKWSDDTFCEAFKDYPAAKDRCDSAKYDTIPLSKALGCKAGRSQMQVDNNCKE